MVAKALFSSATDEWATPQAFFEALDAEFGFDVDVCALDSTAKCNVYFGPDHWDEDHRDGLATNWSAFGRTGDGRAAVWMNPPYSHIRTWMQKAYAESLKGATVVCLVPSRTDTRWWHETVEVAKAAGTAEVRFVKGRLKFGGAKNSAPFPSVVVVFRPPGSP